jgi:replicative DNA helicase
LSVRSNKSIGISTGLKNLDKMTGGFIPETIVVAARPSMGKSAIMLNFAKQASKVGTVKIYELEMSGVRLTDRLIMSESNTDIDRYRSGYMNDDEFMETQAATEKIKN